MLRWIVCALALFAGACGGDGALGGTPANRVGDADGQLGPWLLAEHPCVANRTDALWVDDASTWWVGCGTGTQGTGLYRTTDAGASWEIPGNSAALSNMRVTNVWRDDTDILYAAGTADNGVRIVEIEGDAVEAFYIRPDDRPQAWETFQVGTFRMDSTGRAVAESLTGSDVIYWPSGTAEKTNGYGWWEGAIDGGAQILDLEVYDDRFYGSGSTINQPPYFYFESDQGMGDRFALNAIKLSPDGLNDFTGEAWDLDIDDDGKAVVAGVNQDTNVATIWFSDGPLSDPSTWSILDLGFLISSTTSTATRLYGSCRAGDLIVGVGDYSQRSEALVVVSTDGGASWGMAAPPGTGADAVGPLTRCQILDDSIYVTGANGFIGVLDATAL
ncbi:MAG: hypothetical protein AB8H79_05240 [Myxococcota bacterium]